MPLKNYLRNIIIISFFSFSLSACKSSDEVTEKVPAPEPDISQINYEKAMVNARIAKKKAASIGGEWRDIGKALEEAEVAASTGDFAKALKLAIKAKEQGDMGYLQATKENGSHPSYIK